MKLIKYGHARIALEQDGRRLVIDPGGLTPEDALDGADAVLIDGTVFHPGDALTVPDVPVPALMLPVHAPWSRIGDLIDWVREVKPQRTVAVHDGALNPVGRAMVDGFLGDQGPAPTGAPYDHLDPGGSREV